VHISSREQLFIVANPRMGERQVDERTEVGGHSAKIKMMGLKGQYCAGPPALAWIIHEVSSQKRKDALKGMMNTGFADPAFPFGASIA
jgi:hypothetical protein